VLSTAALIDVVDIARFSQGQHHTVIGFTPFTR
jgi:hypothetical protein